MPEPQLRHLQPGFSIRAALLGEALRFVLAASRLDGIRRIALLGSLATEKSKPKDCDLLVEIDRDIDLSRLATLGRRLKGVLGGMGSGADVFLCDPAGVYLGRICEWKECWPRVRCDALHCGRQPHLHDDLTVVTLKAELIAAPPVELWPVVLVRSKVPADVEQLLVLPLRDGAASTRDSPT
jgi:predicted nucleotidyltransferase